MLLRISRGRQLASMTTKTFHKFAAGTQPFTVFIEGNIGSGKTTYLNHFTKYEKDVCLITEPVEKWRNLYGANLLELMYADPDRWAMPFQTYVTITMLQSHTMPTDKSVKIMERSLFSAKYCFVQNQYQNKIIPQAMFDIINEWYSFIDKSIHIQSDLIVYLRTTPEVVYERMKKRARPEESCVPLEYLRELHELHENWLMKPRKDFKTPVLVLNGDLDLERIGEEYVRSEERIIKFAAAEMQSIRSSPQKIERLSG